MRTSESTQNLIGSLLAARRLFAPVVKGAVGQVGQNREYKYADLGALLDATLPALLDQGIVVLQAVDAETSTLITRLAHTSGEWAEAAYPLKLDQAPQAFGSALTYGRRYSLQALLCLAAEDDDGAAAQPIKPRPRAPRPEITALRRADDPPVSEAQRRRLFALAKEHGWTTEAMKAHLEVVFGLASSKDLPGSKYEAVCLAFSSPAVPAGGEPF